MGGFRLPAWGGAGRLRGANLVSAMLILLLAARMVLLCIPRPMLGYANNYDFIRQSACTGVWLRNGLPDKVTPTPDRPVSTLIFDGDRRKEACAVSPDILFPWIVAHLAGRGAHFGLRWIGLAKILVALGLMGVLAAQTMRPVIRLGLCVAAFLSLGDVALLLYFDTLYSEASFVIACFFLSAFAIVAWCGERKPGWPFVGLVCALGFYLAFARTQYALAAIIILLGVALVFARGWKDWRRAAAICGAVVALAVGRMELTLHESAAMRAAEQAGHADTFLGAVLPAAKDPAAALKLAGLPPSCAAVIGQDWYTPGFQSSRPCPALFKLHRAMLLRLFLSDRHMALWPMSEAIKRSRPSVLPYLAHAEKPDLLQSGRYAVLLNTSLSTWLTQWSGTQYWALLWSLCVAGPVALALFAVMGLRRGGRIPPDARLALLGLGGGGCLVLYALATSVFGDGYFEMQRHAAGILIGMGFACAGLVWSVSPALAFGRRLAAPWQARVLPLLALPREQAAKPSRLPALQVLRFAASFAVMIHHSLLAFGPPVTGVAVGAAGVDVFFVISGVVIGYVDHDDGAVAFAAKRIIRVIPLYWLATLVYGVFRFYAWHDDPDPARILRSLFLVPDFGAHWVPIYYPAWTLAYEMAFYALFGALLPWLRGATTLAAAVIAIALSGMAVPVPFLPGAFFDTGLLIEFAAGLLIAEAWRRRFVLPPVVGGLALILAVAGFAGRPDYGGALRVLFWGPPAILLVLGALSLQHVPVFRWRFLNLGGDASYALYLFHIPVMEGLYFALRHYDVDLTGSALGIALREAVLLSGALIVGLAVHLWVEKPMLRALRQFVPARR